MDKSTIDPWSEAWERPSLTSFAVSFKENYDGPILEFWQSQITSDLKHIVDLACGNGALIWIANDIIGEQSNKTKLTGVDYSDIKPFKNLKKNPDDFPNVSFIGNTGIENLPFDDGSIDLVISQYGLEYSNIDQSIPEIGRVLSPTGRMACITHDIDGVIGKTAAQTHEDYKTINNIIRCDELIIKLAELKGRLTRNTKSADTKAYKELLPKIQANMNIVRSIIAKHPSDYSLQRYRTAIDHSFQEAQKAPEKRSFDVKATLVNNRMQFEITIERKIALMNACMNKNDRKHLLKLIKQAGFQITEYRTLEQKPGENWGTIFAAKRKSKFNAPLSFIKDTGRAIMRKILKR